MDRKGHAFLLLERASSRIPPSCLKVSLSLLFSDVLSCLPWEGAGWNAGLSRREGTREYAFHTGCVYGVPFKQAVWEELVRGVCILSASDQPLALGSMGQGWEAAQGCCPLDLYQYSSLLLTARTELALQRHLPLIKRQTSHFRP